MFEVSEMYGDNSIGSADGATYSSDAATFNSNETNEVFEGTRAISITWSGMGVALIITSPQNLSNYTHFGFSFNSPDPTGGDGEGFGLQLKIKEGANPSDTTTERGNLWLGDIQQGEFDGGPVSSGSLSDQIIADGEWHDLVVPLSLFEDLDKSQISGFGFYQGSSIPRTVFIDNIRFEREITDE